MIGRWDTFSGMGCTGCVGVEGVCWQVVSMNVGAWCLGKWENTGHTDTADCWTAFSWCQNRQRFFLGKKQWEHQVISSQVSKLSSPMVDLWFVYVDIRSDPISHHITKATQMNWQYFLPRANLIFGSLPVSHNHNDHNSNLSFPTGSQYITLYKHFQGVSSGCQTTPPAFLWSKASSLAIPSSSSSKLALECICKGVACLEAHN